MLGPGKASCSAEFGGPAFPPWAGSKYERGTRGSWALDRELRKRISWRVSNISPSAPRRIALRMQTPVLLYRGAPGQGRVAAALFIDGERLAFATNLPQRMTCEFGIYGVELAGTPWELLHRASRRPGAPSTLSAIAPQLIAR